METQPTSWSTISTSKQQIEVEEGVWVEYNPVTKTSIVLNRAQLEKDVSDAERRLAEIPEPPSDEELLTWAKENYPQMDYSREKELLERIVSEHKETMDRLR